MCRLERERPLPRHHHRCHHQHQNHLPFTPTSSPRECHILQHRIILYFSPTSDDVDDRLGPNIVVLIQPRVQAVVEIVGGDHQEGEEENDGVNSVVSVPDNSEVSQIILNEKENLHN